MRSDAQLLAVVVIVPFVAVIVQLVRRQRLRAKYSFLWLVVAACILPLGLFPGALHAVASAAGVFYPPAVLFFGAIMMLLFLSVHFSWELSRLEERTRVLAEELALANAQLVELGGRVAGDRFATGGPHSVPSPAAGSPRADV